MRAASSSTSMGTAAPRAKGCDSKVTPLTPPPWGTIESSPNLEMVPCGAGPQEGGRGWPKAPQSGVPGGKPLGTAGTGIKAAPLLNQVDRSGLWTFNLWFRLPGTAIARGSSETAPLGLGEFQLSPFPCELFLVRPGASVVVTLVFLASVGPVPFAVVARRVRSLWTRMR
jgi:hypothetical protein